MAQVASSCHRYKVPCRELEAGCHPLEATGNLDPGQIIGEDMSVSVRKVVLYLLQVNVQHTMEHLTTKSTDIRS
jgi:hypothetical protein